MGLQWIIVVVIVIMVLVAVVMWWRWGSITTWVKQQRQPFNEWLQELKEQCESNSTIESESGVQHQTVHEQTPRPPSINYRSEDYTSESVQTRELLQQFRTDPNNRHRYFYEEQCRRIFEDLFPGYRFSKCRPSWLVNPRTDHALELDGYNDELHLAFEYNGPQHYRFPNPYHRTADDFIQQKFRDLVKHRLCNQHGVYLLTIPYHVPRHHLRSFIKQYLVYYRECVGM